MNPSSDTPPDDPFRRFQSGRKWGALLALSMIVHVGLLSATSLLPARPGELFDEPSSLAVRLVAASQSLASVAVEPANLEAPLAAEPPQAGTPAQAAPSEPAPRPRRRTRPQPKPKAEPEPQRSSPPEPQRQPESPAVDLPEAQSPLKTAEAENSLPSDPALVPTPPATTPTEAAAAEPMPTQPANAAADPTPAPDAGSADAGEPPPTPQQVQSPFVASVPPSATVEFELRVTGAGLASGTYESQLEWEEKGNSYALRLGDKKNRFQFTSEGSIDSRGLTPRRYTDKRLWKPMVATNFDPEQKAIRFSSRSDSVAMELGAQDTVSVAVQLAAFARGSLDALKSGTALTVQVADSRRVGQWTWRAEAEETLDTALGPLRTLRMTRYPPAGSFENTVEIWLAADHEWIPVRIKRTEAKGTVWDFFVTAIHLKRPSES